MSMSERTLPSQHTIHTTDSTAMTSAGFEPAIPAMEQPPNYTFDHMATRIGKYVFLQQLLKPCLSVNYYKSIIMHKKSLKYMCAQFDKKRACDCIVKCT